MTRTGGVSVKIKTPRGKARRDARVDVLGRLGRELDKALRVADAGERVRKLKQVRSGYSSARMKAMVAKVDRYLEAEVQSE